MTDKEKQEWLEVKYPLTIISDRYDGTYSGASWLAFPLYCDEVPPAVDGYDEACAAFWKDYSEPVGKGNSAQNAIENLISQMHKQEDEENDFEHKLGEIIYKSIPVYSGEDDKKAVEIADKRAKYYAPILLELAKKKLQEEQKSDIRVRHKTRKECYLEGLEAGRKEQKSVETKAYLGLASNEFEACMLRYLQSASNRKNDFEINVDTKKYAGQLLEIAKKEQKPAKWSEEDEEIYKEVLQSFESVTFKEHHYGTGKFTYAQVIVWLKSIRPDTFQNGNSRWKPSDEQMNALEMAVTFFKTQWTGAKVKEQLALESLYEQLKKL